MNTHSLSSLMLALIFASFVFASPVDASSCYGSLPVKVFDFAISTPNAGATKFQALATNATNSNSFTDLFARAEWRFINSKKLELTAYFDYRTAFSFEYPIYRIEYVAYNRSNQVIFYREFDYTNECTRPLGVELMAGQHWKANSIVLPSADLANTKFQVIIWGGHE